MAPHTDEPAVTDPTEAPQDGEGLRTDTTPAGRAVLRNSIAVTSAEWFTKVTNFAFTVFVVRRLGETGYGNYASAIAFVGISSVLFELGLTESLQRTIARDHSRARDLFWNAVGLRLVLALPALLFVPLAAWLVGYERPVLLGIALQVATFLPSALLVPMTLLLAARERLDVSSRVAMAMNVIYTFLCAGLLIAFPNYLVLIAVAFVTMPINIVLLKRASLAVGIHIPPVLVRPSTWPALVRQGLPFALSSLALTFNYQADSVLLGLMGTSADVGWYSAAYRLIFSLSATVAGFTRSITPTLSRLYSQDPEESLRWVRGGIVGLTFLALPAGVGLSILATPVTRLLYGSGFEPSGTALAILAWDFPFLAIGAFGGNVTTAMNLERVAARVYLAAALFNVVANALLIPRYGIVATSALTVITDAIILVALYTPIARTVFHRRTIIRLCQIVAASAIMGAVVWIFRALPLGVSIALGVISYALACAAMGLRSVAAIRDLGNDGKVS